MRKYFAVLFLLSAMPGWTQSSVSLDSCISWSYAHYEYEKQAIAYRNAAELEDKNASKNWYPKFALDANATYQNENISIPIALPGLEAPSVPLNFNRILVNFNQAIYDGSVTANQRKLSLSKYSMLEQKVETEKIKVRSKVIGIYMSILLTTDNIALLRSKSNVVTERLKVIRAANELGSVTVVSIRSLEAEALKIEQQVIESEHTLSASYLSLSEITSRDISAANILIRPLPLVSYDNDVEERPEIKLLSMQVENFELQKDMIGTSRNMRINAFGNVGGGLPGYDIFKDELAPMALVGIKLKWNILDYGKVKNEKQILSLNQNITLSEQNRARSKFSLELKIQHQEVKKMQELLAKDDALIELRSEITTIKAAELENGTITSTDYLTELDQEEEAKLNQKIHELKLLLAELNYLTIQGK